MYRLAILIGFYSYSVFFLSLFSGLTTANLTILSVFFIVLLFFLLKPVFKIVNPINEKFSLIIFGLIFTNVIINLIGAFGPELAFDALWYHLTLPKIYLLNNSIFYIPGGLLYYSAMPKLGEMLFMSGIIFFGEAGAKIIHFSFGLLSGIVLYRLSRLFLSKSHSLLVVLVFFSNLVFAWQSITAYIDLIRTFFQSLALLALMYWLKSKKLKWILLSGLMLGLEISTKLLGLISLAVFLIILGTVSIKEKRLFFKESLVLFFSSLILPMPWFVFSFFSTGNPVYPFFQGKINILNEITVNILNPFIFLTQSWNLLLKSADPISPIYLISVPLIVYFLKKSSYIFKILSLYVFTAFLIWYITDFVGHSIPEIRGGSRFFLPYLPAFSLLVVLMIERLTEKKLQNFLVGIIFLIAVSSIVYRGAANAKYFPVIVGVETKQSFLAKNLNFSFGDFYDTDGYFKNNIKPNEKVLLYGFHNLYYVDFPFIDSSWVKDGDSFNYVAVQNFILPNKFKTLKEVYRNRTTKVRLFKCEKICLY